MATPTSPRAVWPMPHGSQGRDQRGCEASQSRRSWDRVSPQMGTKKTLWIRAVVLATFGAATIGLAAPASADVDTDFANELHTYGIYGQKDYNAWIGKIQCKRLRTGLDANAGEAA